MKKDFLIVLGLNDKDTKTQLKTTDVAIDETQDIVGESTIQTAYGCYVHDDGTKIKETSLKIEIFNQEVEVAEYFCQQLKVHFNQECVVLKAEGEKAQFI